MSKCNYCDKELKEFDDIDVFNGFTYCSSCFESIFGWCELCDTYQPIENFTSVNDTHMCRGCFINNYHTCDSCDFISHMDNGGIYYYENFDGYLCDDCYPEYFFYCESCEQDIDTNEQCYIVEGIYYCSDCYTELITNTTEIRGILKDFIAFEKLNPFPERILRLWILYLLDDNFRCPCGLGNYTCGTSSCPRKRKNCSVSYTYQHFDRFGEKRQQFIRVYLIRKLTEIYYNSYNVNVSFKGLHDLLKGYKGLQLI